jgi:uncharacterized SAM-binding protein YcdF (DUF218 family)
MNDLAQRAADLNTVSAFLAAPDVVELTPDAIEAHLGQPSVDMLILLGNAVLHTIDAAAEAYTQGAAAKMMVVGGEGHSTSHLRAAVRADPRYDGAALDDQPEAVIIRGLLARWHGIDEPSILIEPTSTNCGANAEEAYALLKAQQRTPQTILLVQDPTMQRRSWASFRRVWDEHDDTQFVNGPTFVPAVRAEDGHLVFEAPERAGRWPMERFITLVMGEIPRLRNDENGYGPTGKGFIVAVDIPPAVEAAYDRLLEPFGDLVRWPPA